MERASRDAHEACRLARSDVHGSFIAVADDASFVHEAVARDSEEAPRPGSLAGIPFAAKDNLDTRDLPTTANTPALLGTRRSTDNPVVARLRTAGAQLVGKTNMHELALGITTTAAAFPATVNPLDPRRLAGGSSGGSAAAVAAGIVPFALATDTGGSVTIPAAWCGLFGLRPSTGRWPGAGVVPLSPTRDTVGVIAESLEMIAAVDHAVCGGTGSVDTGREAEKPPSRIGVPDPGSVFSALLDDDVRSVWGSSLARISADPRIEAVHLDAADTDDLHRLEARCGAEIEFFEISHALTAYLSGLPVPLSFDELIERVARDDVRELLRESYGRRHRTAEYAEALRVRDELRARYEALFEGVGLDALVFPSAPMVAPLLEEHDRVVFGGAEHDVFELGTRNINPGSVSGQPAVTLPAGRCEASNDSTDPVGMPVGITLEGPRGADRRLLAVSGTVLEALEGESSDRV